LAVQVTSPHPVGAPTLLGLSPCITACCAGAPSISCPRTPSSLSDCRRGRRWPARFTRPAALPPLRLVRGHLGRRLACPRPFPVSACLPPSRRLRLTRGPWEADNCRPRSTPVLTMDLLRRHRTQPRTNPRHRSRARTAAEVDRRPHHAPAPLNSHTPLSSWPERPRINPRLTSPLRCWAREGPMAQEVAERRPWSAGAASDVVTFICHCPI
jgi:hypothetical protein